MGLQKSISAALERLFNTGDGRDRSMVGGIVNNTPLQWRNTSDANVSVLNLDASSVTQLSNGANIPTGKTLTDVDAGTHRLNRPRITTSIDDINGNEVIKTPATASAVNEITVTNAATGSAPTVSTTGNDTNISLSISPKGTGTVSIPTLALGTNIATEKVAHALYSFAIDGGLQSTITPATTANIPDNAIITRVVVNSTTAVTSAGLATVAVGTSLGSSSTSLLGATAKASLGMDVLVIGTPVPQTVGTWVKMTAAGNITFTIGTADLTAGVIEVWVFYVAAAA